MIIIDSADSFSLNIAIVFASLGLDVHILDNSSGSERAEIAHKNLHRIAFTKRQTIDSGRFVNFGDRLHMDDVGHCFMPTNIAGSINRLFPKVRFADKKMVISILSQLRQREMGMLVFYANQYARENDKHVFYLHTSLKRYMEKRVTHKSSMRFMHFYVPFKDIISMTRLLWSSARSIYISVLTPNLRLRRRCTSQKPNVSVPRDSKSVRSINSYETAVVYHQSPYYGRLIEKRHYFSSDSVSPLHESKVLKLISHSESPMEGYLELHHKDRVYIGFEDLFSSTLLLLRLLPKIRSVSTLYTVLFLSVFFAKYNSYIRFFRNLKCLRNVIYDYDVNTSKPLMFALETLGITTLALQERPNLVFGEYSSGVFCDVYFYCGPLYRKYAQSKMNTVMCNVPVDFGFWRKTIYEDPKLIDLNEISFAGRPGQDLCAFNDFILFLGLFLGAESDPFLCRSSFDKFMSDVKLAATTFPSLGVVIRLKSVDTNLSQYISEYFREYSNVFLCNDYSRFFISYRLCREARVVVSLMSSLADECLSFGKQVILLDDHHVYAGDCCRIYPEEFRFLIAKSNGELLSLLNRCLQQEACLNNKYFQLQREVSGQTGEVIDNLIPDTLARYLDREAANIP